MHIRREIAANVSVSVVYYIVGICGLLLVSLYFPKVSQHITLGLFQTIYQPSQNSSTGLLLFAAPMKSAFDSITTEQDRINTEINAFESFAEQIRTLSVPKQAQTATNIMAVQEFSPHITQNQRILELYQKTIMEVPHFEEDYNESIQQSMISEFSPEVCVTLFGNEELSPALKNSIYVQTQGAIQQRKNLLQMVNQEEKSLLYLDSKLENLNDGNETECPENSLPIEIIPEEYEKLEGLEEEIHGLLVKRQQDIHSINRNHNHPMSSYIQEYLYQSIEHTFPGLFTILSRLDEVQQAKKCLIHQYIQA